MYKKRKPKKKRKNLNKILKERIVRKKIMKSKNMAGLFLQPQ